jgi:hypothetical protein
MAYNNLDNAFAALREAQSAMSRASAALGRLAEECKTAHPVAAELLESYTNQISDANLRMFELEEEIEDHLDQMPEYLL